MQPDLKCGQHYREQGGSFFARQFTQAACDLAGEPEIMDGSPAAGQARPDFVSRQFQRRRQIAELFPPVIA